MLRLFVILFVFSFFSCKKNGMIVDVDMVEGAFIQNMTSNLNEEVLEYEDLIKKLNQAQVIPITKYKAHSLIIFHYKDGDELKIRTDGYNVGPIGQKFYRSSTNLLE